MSNTTEFAEKLQTAIENGKLEVPAYVDPRVKAYTWKGKKEKSASGEFVQETVTLMDASEAQLRKFYNHCVSMLYNQDRQNPGRRPLLEIIQSQKDRCGVELFLRESESEGTSRYAIIESVKQAIRNSGVNHDEARSMLLKEFVTVNSQYANLPIKLVQDGCLLKLGKFDKSHITLTFILKQGLRITEDEEQELTEYTIDGKGNSVKRNYLDVVKERLNIADHMKLKIDAKGLTYTQLRAMLNLKSRYYNELNTEQLRTLRNRILFSLEDDIMFHITQWETRMIQIQEVAAIRGIEL